MLLCFVRTVHDCCADVITITVGIVDTCSAKKTSERIQYKLCEYRTSNKEKSNKANYFLEVCSKQNDSPSHLQWSSAPWTIY